MRVVVVTDLHRGVVGLWAGNAVNLKGVARDALQGVVAEQKSEPRPATFGIGKDEGLHILEFVKVDQLPVPGLGLRLALPFHQGSHEVELVKAGVHEFGSPDQLRAGVRVAHAAHGEAS